MRLLLFRLRIFWQLARCGFGWRFSYREARAALPLSDELRKVLDREPSA